MRGREDELKIDEELAAGQLNVDNQPDFLPVEINKF